MGSPQSRVSLIYKWLVTFPFDHPDHLNRTQVGNPKILQAPEVWALGVILYALCHGRLGLFGTDGASFDSLGQKKTPRRSITRRESNDQPKFTGSKMLVQYFPIFT